MDLDKMAELAKKEEALAVTPEEMEEVKDVFEKTKIEMRRLGGAIEEALGYLHHKKMGFVLTVFEFGEDSRTGNYISNAKREDVILALRELADRLEIKQGVVEGEPNG